MKYSMYSYGTTHTGLLVLVCSWYLAARLWDWSASMDDEPSSNFPKREIIFLVTAHASSTIFFTSRQWVPIYSKLDEYLLRECHIWSNTSTARRITLTVLFSRPNLVFPPFPPFPPSPPFPLSPFFLVSIDSFLHCKITRGQLTAHFSARFFETCISRAYFMHGVRLVHTPPGSDPKKYRRICAWRRQTVNSRARLAY